MLRMSINATARVNVEIKAKVLMGAKVVMNDVTNPK